MKKKDLETKPWRDLMFTPHLEPGGGLCLFLGDHPCPSELLQNQGIRAMICEFLILFSPGQHPFPLGNSMATSFGQPHLPSWALFMSLSAKSSPPPAEWGHICCLLLCSFVLHPFPQSLMLFFPSMEFLCCLH